MSEDTIEIPKVNIDVFKEREKPRLQAVLFADYADIGRSDKGVVGGLFDRIFIDPKKKATGRFYLFIKAAEIRQGALQISIFDPQGTMIGTGLTDEIDNSDIPSPKAVQVIHSLNLDSVIEGLYWFDVSYEGKSLGGAALSAVFAKQEVKDGSEHQDVEEL